MRKITRRSFLAAAAACGAAAALTACGGSSASTAASSAAGSTAGSAAASGSTIKVGVLGPMTGDVSVYGLAVINGASLYLKQVNADGGVNGKQLEIITMDEQGDETQAVTCFTKMVDQGITALVGDVTTAPTLTVAAARADYNMPMVTASATAEAVTYDAETDTVNGNVFRACFTDPFQGVKMADYAYKKLGYTKAAVIVQTGNDYAAGLNEAFKAKCAELGITVVAEEGYAKGDKDFNAQLTNIKAADPEFIFCPNYYEDDGMIVKQARALGLTVPFLGGDGWDGVVKYASAEELEGTFYCSAYAPGSTDAVKAFEEAYTAAYGTDTLNMFAANAYDAAMVMCAALAKAEETGEAPASDAYKQAVIDAIKTEGANVVGITSEAGYTFDANNNPIKDAVIMTITNGEAVYKETF